MRKISMRLAMGLAMTIWSSTMLIRHAIKPYEQFREANLKVVSMWEAAENKATVVKNRAAEYYRDLRLVYRVERRLRDLQERVASEARREVSPGKTIQRYGCDADS